MKLRIPLRLTVESKIGSHIPPHERKDVILEEYNSFIYDLTLYDTIQSYLDNMPNLDDIDISIEKENPTLTINKDGSFTIYTILYVEISGDSVTLETKQSLLNSINRTTEYMSDRLLPDYDQYFRGEIGTNDTNNNNMNNNREPFIFEGQPRKQLYVLSPEATKRNVKGRINRRAIQGIEALPQNVTNIVANYLHKPMSETNKNRVRPLPEALSNTTLLQPFEERFARAEEARSTQATKNLEAVHIGGRRRKTRKSRNQRKMRKTPKTCKQCKSRKIIQRR